MADFKLGKEPCLICLGRGKSSKEEGSKACSYCDGTGLVVVRFTGDPDIVKKVHGVDIIKYNGPAKKKQDS